MSLLKHWRHLLLAMVAIAALGTLAACGDDDDDSGGTATATTRPSGATGGRIDGGDMTVTSQKVESLDPHYSNFFQDISLQRLLWRGLYSMDKDNAPQPSMAASQPDISADGKVYTITLRDGLKWSDGDDLTAEDFVAGFRRTCNPVNAGTYEGVIDQSIVGCHDLFNALSGPDGKAKTADDLAAADAGLPALEEALGVKAIDSTTLKITLAQAQPTFPLIISLWLAFPVPTHLDRFANQTADAPAAWGTDASALVYNGPYMMTSFNEGGAKLAPNPNWSEDYSPVGAAPTLDTLTIQFVTGSQADAFRTGELDETNADVSNLQSQKGEFGAKFFQAAQPGTRGIEMSLTHPPLDKLEVRLALSQAIDRDTFNQVAAGGAYVPTTSWLPKDVDGEAPDFFADQIGFDPEKAKANLATAGYPDGAGFPVLSMLIYDTPDRVAQAEFLQKSFKDVLNIDTTIEKVDADTRSARLNNHDFELAPRSGWIQDYPDPENWIVSLFDTGGGNNIYECSDPDIDDLIEKAHFNTNNAERLDQYKQVNALIVTRVCGIAPIYHEAQSWLISDKVTGMVQNSGAQNASMPGDWAAEAWGFKA